ncbi:MAG: MATE family efflux transporter [Marinifilaceae bacterium]
MKSENQIAELEHTPIRKLLLKYFIPAVTGVIVNALYNIVDRIFIGQGVDALALSGLSATFPLVIIMFAFAMLVAMGSNVRISMCLGKKDITQAERTLGVSTILVAILAFLLTIAGYYYRLPLLSMFGAGADSIGYADNYFKYLVCGNVIMSIGFVLNNAIRAEGNAKIAMYSLFLSAGTNIILDPIFIFWLNMGVKGAAIATVISQAVLMIWVIAHFRRKHSIIKLHSYNLRIDTKIIKYILAIGFAPFSMQLAAGAVQAILNTQLNNYGGDLAVGAMGIVNSVAQLLVMSIIAINMAAQPIVSFNYGAGNKERVRETLKISLVFATLISLMGFALIMIFPRQLVMLFNRDNEELLKIGTHGLRIFLCALPLIGFQIITGNFYQAIGRAGIAALLSLMRQVIILIPVLLILPRFLSLTGVWIAAPISDILASIITIFFTFKAFAIINKE